MSRQLMKKGELPVLHKISDAMALQDSKGFTLKLYHPLIELKEGNTLMLMSLGTCGHKGLEKDYSLHIIVFGMCHLTMYQM